MAEIENKLPRHYDDTFRERIKYFNRPNVNFPGQGLGFEGISLFWPATVPENVTVLHDNDGCPIVAAEDDDLDGVLDRYKKHLQVVTAIKNTEEIELLSGQELDLKVTTFKYDSGAVSTNDDTKGRFILTTRNQLSEADNHTDKLSKT